MGKWLTENDVIGAVCEYLKENGYSISKQCTTTQKGKDIIAKKNEVELYVEAKGDTSSKKGSKRYKKEFNSNQVKDHVAKALLTAMGYVSEQIPNRAVAIALPDNENHNKAIDNIDFAIKKLDIGVYFVDENKKVRKMEA